AAHRGWPLPCRAHPRRPARACSRCYEPVHIAGASKTTYGLTTPRCLDWHHESNRISTDNDPRDSQAHRRRAWLSSPLRSSEPAPISRHRHRCTRSAPTAWPSLMPEYERTPPRPRSAPVPVAVMDMPRRSPSDDLQPGRPPRRGRVTGSHRSARGPAQARTGHRRRQRILTLLAALACLAGFALAELNTSPSAPVPPRPLVTSPSGTDTPAAGPAAPRRERVAAVSWPADGVSAADISGFGVVAGPGATRPVPTHTPPTAEDALDA